MMSSTLGNAWVLVACAGLLACGASDGAADSQGGTAGPVGSVEERLDFAQTRRSISFDFAHFDAFPAGVAGGEDVVFVGLPLDGRVVVLSRRTGKQIGELPPPPGGFVVAFIMHSNGPHQLAVLDAGGFPSPKPFVGATPTIYDYTYSYSEKAGFSAKLVRTTSFVGTPFGFSEDFATLEDGTRLVSDAILGSIWVVKPDGSIHPGIVPKTFAPADALPKLAFCPTMPLTHVDGIPFLFTGSTLPGVSPLAVRDGIVYYASPCARGAFKFPLSILFDHRQPYERAADVRLFSPEPADTIDEELLEFTFNPFDRHDRFIYAADALQLRIIRIDPRTGERQVVANDKKLFDFPASLGFLPPVHGVAPLMVVSNQQHRTPLLNDAITEDVTELPYLVTGVVLKD